MIPDELKKVPLRSHPHVVILKLSNMGSGLDIGHFQKSSCTTDYESVVLFNLIYNSSIRRMGSNLET